jgi:hypothetical protein
MRRMESIGWLTLKRIILVSEQTEHLGQLSVEVIEEGPIYVVFNALNQRGQRQRGIETDATMT